ncbi:MAG: hypothetical protein AAFR45_01600, partial [Pseudomonadota bacterium]
PNNPPKHKPKQKIRTSITTRKASERVFTEQAWWPQEEKSEFVIFFSRSRKNYIFQIVIGNLIPDTLSNRSLPATCRMRTLMAQT